MKNTYKIPVTWQMFDYVLVEADSLKEAIEQAYDFPLTPGEYIDGSFNIDEETLKYDYPEEYREEKINKIID
jgi:hypothetical protein